MNAVLAQEFLQREIEGKVKITDDEIETYYKGHKEEFTNPESVKARHILLKVPEGADEKAWKEAESKAKDIKEKLAKTLPSLQRNIQMTRVPKTRAAIWAFSPKGAWYLNSSPQPFLLSQVS
jgi:hypothetical protein